MVVKSILELYKPCFRCWFLNSLTYALGKISESVIHMLLTHKMRMSISKPQGCARINSTEVIYVNKALTKHLVQSTC